MSLFKAPNFDDIEPLDEVDPLPQKHHQHQVEVKKSDVRPSKAYEELFAANREIRRLRVCLHQIANAPRKSTVADVKRMAKEALSKRKGDS